MATKQDYFDAAFDMLSAEGYSALKQAPLCKRLNVTTGSFYHYFQNWHDFTSQLLDHWLADRTTRLVGLTGDQDDPLEQLETLLEFALALPHRAEAAIRVWSRVDPEVGAVQERVDRSRTEVVLRAARAVFDDEREALARAHSAMYLLAGFQELDPGGDTATLEWALRRLLREFAEQHAARTGRAPAGRIGGEPPAGNAPAEDDYLRGHGA